MRKQIVGIQMLATASPIDLRCRISSVIYYSFYDIRLIRKKLNTTDNDFAILSSILSAIVGVNLTTK